MNTLEALILERRTTDISIGDLSGRSGINQALVKYHFGNKAGLLFALLQRAMRPAMTQFDELASASLSPFDKIRSHIQIMVDSYHRFPYINRLMHQLILDDAEKYGVLITREFSRPAADAQRKILEEGAKKGVFKRVDPMLFYFHIVGACDQLFYGRNQLQNVFGFSEVTDDIRRRYVDHLSDILLSGLAVAPRRRKPAARPA